MDTEKSGSEKRKFERVTIPGLKVSFKLLDPRTWSSYHERILSPVRNISVGGVSLKTSSEIVVKAPVGIDISFNPERESIRTFGRVAWIKKSSSSDSDYDLGISFSWWKREEDKKVVYEAIKHHRT